MKSRAELEAELMQVGQEMSSLLREISQLIEQKEAIAGESPDDEAFMNRSPEIEAINEKQSRLRVCLMELRARQIELRQQLECMSSDQSDPGSVP
ncbi:MAG: hypothetical protein U0795_20690 [Pirellulales bacterium]